MGRWTDMDSDAERLPCGFERIGYDADTQTYTFRDADGTIYESEPGNRYGEMHRVDSRSSSQSSRSASIHLLDNRNGRPSRTFDEIFNHHQDAISKDSRDASHSIVVKAVMKFRLNKEIRAGLLPKLATSLWKNC
ncbi:hypothetical protein COCHEDRAFT_1178620 [Bipolaris maydis C5]|uniref:Carbohydrate-binding module family 50 protein n=1 Tax=Cochliobolus heterostrophus (strain C5 / ATCC 48332 / race O) TaxID=701091 RepID=M2SXQ9_COCH5|nr:hypothetical protein COCHEDRAFT_1178620 [Bipolaris maydis C5]